MDLSSPIHDPSFPSSKGLSSFYNWPEIWPFPNADGVHVYCPGVSDIGAASPKTELIERISGFPETIGNNQDASGGESTITEQSGSHGSGGRRRRRDAAAASEDDESSKLATISGGNEMMNFKSKSLKVTGSGGEINNSKAEVEARSRNDNPSFEKSAPKQDFIHVRARRGQATDSHSLAERARREKISERMKILQHLVPGCNKVNGKASVLDEIINYIQSLQCEVEFLSMKLEAINTRMNSSMEGFSAKETYDAAAMIFGSHGTREFGQGSAPGWLHMQVGGGFERLA